jgi:hypothetical protein
MKKKSLRRNLSSLLVAAFILMNTFGLATAAATSKDAGDIIKIKLNDKYLVTDTAPMIENGVTLVPVRLISEALGAAVNWNGQNRSIMIKTKDDAEILLSIGSPEATVSSKAGSRAERMGASPFLKDGRAMVPLRFIADQLGVNVNWDNSSRTISLTGSKTENMPDGLKVNSKVIESKTEVPVVKMTIPQIEGMTDKQAQDSINNNFEKQALQFQADTLAGLDEYVKECQKEGWPIRAYEAVTDYKVTYSGNDVLSLYVDYYAYTGGAHGSTDRVASTIDLKTGKELQLKDWFKSEDDYQKIINTAIKQQMQLDPDQYFPETLKEWQGISENQPYYIEDGNLVIYFAQYEIAPYSSGMPEFKIPLAKGLPGAGE